MMYRHHYVFSDKTQTFEDIKRRNRLRVWLPLPLRASFIVGACLFTDETLPR